MRLISQVDGIRREWAAPFRRENVTEIAEGTPAVARVTP